MQNNKTINWGVIGGGSVCEVKSVPAMYKAENSCVKSVMRRNADKAADFAARHNISTWTNSLDEILSDPEINVIYIATPPDSHAEITRKAAAAGKAVYVEKPMANTVEECQSMVNACKQANVPLFVAYYRRSLPGFLKVKELVGNGTLGEIRFVNIEMHKPIHPRDLNPDQSNWRVIPELSGGGYFHDLASHQLDYLDYLLGPIVKANGIGANQAKLYPADDILTANFQFANGAMGTGVWCYATSPLSAKDSISIIGSKGQLKLNTFGNPMRIELNTESTGEQVIEYNHPDNIQQYLVKTILDELHGNGVCPSTGISATRTNWVMEQITHCK